MGCKIRPFSVKFYIGNFAEKLEYKPRKVKGEEK